MDLQIGIRPATGLAATALLTLGLSACGGPQATWQGVEVKEPQKALDTVEAAWKTHLAESDAKVRTTEDTHCFFQTTESDGARLIGEKALCGPYRALGADSTAWDTAPLMSVPAGEGAMSLTLQVGNDGKADFSTGKPAPNMTPWRPDGPEAKLDAVVEEPDAPKMAEGDTLEGVTMPQGAKAVESEQVAMPTGRYVTSFTTASRAGTGESRRQAPDGGTILVYQVRRATSDSSSSWSSTRASGQTSVSIKAAGKDYPIKTDDLSSSGEVTGAVALPGDGKDATFAFTYDGLTQSIDAAGKRAGTAAAGYYLPVHKGTSPDIKVVNGSTDEAVPGWHSDATLRNITVELAAYDETKKWAPDGKVWAQLSAGYNESTTKYTLRGKSWGESYQTTAQLAKVTLGGVPATSSSFTASYGQGLKALFLLPADPQARSLKLQAVVTSKGPVASYADAAAPANASTTYTFDGAVALQE